MNTPLLELKNVSRRYGDRGQWFAVRDASLHVGAGDFVAIVGPSGSGKSTLLNILGLLDNAWEGVVQHDRIDVRSFNQHKRDELRSSTIGFVFQSSYANPYESTARNAALGLAIRGEPLSHQVAKVERVLRVVGLDSKADTLARNLSGGERQRLAIARALATEPRILLADEPTGNLDSRAAHSVMELLTTLNNGGTTVVVITHDPAVAQYAKRVISVQDGVVSDVSQSPPMREEDGEALRLLESAVKSTHFRLSKFRWSERIFRATNNVASRPLRSATLVAAFTIAIAGIVTAAGIGASASQQIADRLATAALDEVRVDVPIILSRESRQDQIDRIINLSRVLAVGEVSPVDAAVARISRSATNGLGDGTFPGTTVGADREALKLYQVQTIPTEALDLFGEPNAGRVALVGEDIAASLGLGTGIFGTEIWVSGVPYEVIGTVPEASRQPNLETSVIIPMAQLNNPSSQLIVRTEVGSSASVAEAIPLALSPDAPGDVRVSTTGDLRNLRIGVAQDLDNLLTSISLALLGLAVLSASSAMFLSVQTRIQELALSRALGLSQMGVATIFIWEGVIVGLAGSLAGVAMGLTTAVMVAAVLGWTATIPWTAVAIAPIVGVLSGALSAFFPAVRAARIDPADAIR